MKEININIEGYNVNGICVGCLNYNRKMFYCDAVKECFKILGNIDVPDGLTIQVCWECLAYVRNVCLFQTQILKSYEILIDYSSKNTFLNAPEDLSKFASQRFSVNCEDIPIDIRSIDIEPMLEVEVKIKTEVEVEKVEPVDVLDTKSEPEIDDVLYSDDIPSQDNDVTSDDDIQLSKLKKKKGKKERKGRQEKKIRKEKKSSIKKDTFRDVEEKHSKKKLGYIRDKLKGVKENYQQNKSSRKLKNLPEDLVEVYVMSEEEMWQIRSEDVASKEFLKLKYKCSDCIIGFNTEKLMNDHMSGKHRPKNTDCQQCDVCKAYFLTKDNVSTHRSLHLNAFKCLQCGVVTTIKHLMMKHVKTHSQTPETYTCTVCGEDFSTKSKLTYHRGICHQEKPQCDCCGKVFANKMTLKYHLKLLPQNKDDKPKEKLYLPCKGCNKVFHSKKSYRAHVVMHDGLSYPCPICGKLFRWKRNLARHTRNHRDRDAGASYECRECGKTFSSRDCYNNHMRFSKRHVGEDAYVHECNYCGKKFAARWCMTDHIDWEHLRKIKYQCVVCYKAFKTAKILVAHMNNIHDGKSKTKDSESDHLCDICGKSYKTVKRLKGHVWAMHTNRSTSKSFKCKLCPATFTWQTSIYKHMKMMHDNKRTKQTRSLPAKKADPYPGIELANRMQYFQQNIVQNIVQTVPPPLGLVQNIV